MEGRVNYNVAILLATFNGIKWLPEQLNSIFKQRDIAITLFISDDSSFDGTWEWLNDQFNSDSRVRILPRTKRMGSAGYNFFRLIREVDFTQFDYIALADQDDKWQQNKLLRACNVITGLGADAYSGNIIAFWLNGRKKLINKSQSQTKWDFLFDSPGPGCTYLVTKKLAIDIQKFIINNPDRMQKIVIHDLFIYAFARSKGYQWIIDDVPMMHYRQHTENQVGANDGLKAYLVRARNVISGWWLGQVALIAESLDLFKNPSVNKWFSGSRLGYLMLSLNFWHCRRSLKDKFLFLFFCLLLMVIGSQPKK
ncbi:MAG: glycosyltransferase [Gammaproteobacteria bacterium]|jgi:rhamnosyltransferase|nr:glycosyltransferase [Gammaproteobacteria bacterium]